MNQAQEREDNKKYIRDISPVSIIVKDGKIVDLQTSDIKVLEIRTDKVTYRGNRLSTLSASGRRKFENLLILAEPKQRLRFHYI